MAQQDQTPSTEQHLHEAEDHDEKTPAEQAVVNQEKDLETGAENPV